MMEENGGILQLVGMQRNRGQNQQRSRKVITIAEKLNVIANIDSQLHYSQISLKNWISKGQVSKLKKNHENISAQNILSYIRIVS